MTFTPNRMSTAHLRRAGVPDHSRGLSIMEISATDDKPTPLPAYSGPAPPMHHRIPPPEGAHGPPSDSGIYEPPPWRPYPASFEGRSADQRRTPNAPQPPLPPPGYPVIPNRELPQLPPEGPYTRQGSLPGAFHSISDAHPPHPAYRPPMNGTPHDAVSHSAPPDYRPRMSFPPQESPTNGDPPPPPPHSLPPAQFSTPVPPHLSHTPAPYDPGYYQSQAYGMRQRKAARATQACDQCRARKAKCDEGRPACSHCKENNMICVYKEVPPHKQEKSTQMLIDRLAHLEDIIYEKTDIIQKVQVEHGNQLTQIIKNIPREPKVKMGKESQKPTVQHLLKQDSSATLQEPETKEETVPVITGQELTSSETTEAGTVTVTTQETLEPGEDGELSIPVEHTTAAHKLLMWPSIKELLSPREYDDDYVMRLEEKRGLIRVYGRGEGDDTSDDVGPPPTRPDYSPEENHTQTAPTSGPWGVSPTPPPTRLLDNGLDESGFLTTDPDRLRRYHRSYMEHIHRLHPFLDQSDLDKRIGQFIRTYCPRSVSDSPSTLNSSNGGDVPRGAKRKRSCDNLQGLACDMQSPTGSKTGRISGRRIERSVGNAIILLVFAIGSICDVSEVPLVPGPVMDDAPDFRKERIPGPTSRSVQSPAGSDSILQTHANVYGPRGRTFPSPSVIDGRKPSLGRLGYPDNRHLRNLDVIPGLAYYAYATQIIGSLQGANGLPHVQAALLAGLYAGQLAHPFQSHGWIYQAARACQVLVRSKRYEQMEDGSEKDLYDFAYWTCLQLESDILAELDLPASGISRSEARISLPKGLFTLALPNEISAPSTMMMFFYSAQIHLRKVLNRVHTDLYKVEKQGQNRWSSNVQEILSMNLELWRTSLPDIMKWKDSDPPPKEINVARMRAKYYGARYIIHRPLLYHALHYAANPDAPPPPVDSPTASALSGSKSQQVSPSMTHSQRASNMVRLSSDLGTMGRNSLSSRPGRAMTYRDLPTKLRRACKVCVDSAILSTEAFDGIDGRPVVTNIFGTAHAQFGNMLVLSATYMSNLSELVDRNDLERLLKRTIEFLLQSRYISPSLRADARILTEIYEKIFGEPAGSFSSIDEVPRNYIPHCLLPSQASPRCALSCSRLNSLGPK